MRINELDRISRQEMLTRIADQQQTVLKSEAGKESIVQFLQYLQKYGIGLEVVFGTGLQEA